MKNIIFGDNIVTFADSLYITVISMTIVFIILLLISELLNLLKIVAKFGGKEEIKSSNKGTTKKEKKEKVIEKEAVKCYEFENLKYKVDDEKVRLAILTASIHATEELGHSNVRINYVREI